LFLHIIFQVPFIVTMSLEDGSTTIASLLAGQLS